MSGPVLRFGAFELDLARQALRADGRPIDLEPLTARLLSYLASNRSRVVPSDELLDEIWSGVAVSEAALHQALRQARRALGDDGKRQACIRTVRGEGYRFVAAASVAGPSRAGSDGEGARDAYVGRAALRAELEGHLEDAIGGRGRIVLLSGEAGIGKTRTLDELADVARRLGVQVARGAGNPHPGAPPYWPILEIFRELSAARPMQRLRREVAAIAPGLLAPADEDEAGVADGTDVPGSDATRFRLFDAATQCLDRASQLGPLLLLLDDLHDAGGSSLELLDFLSRSVGRMPLLLVAAYRPDGAMRAPGRARSLARLAERDATRVAKVEALSDSEARELVRRHQRRALDPEWVETLTRRAQGNPFYLVELARLLGAEDDARRWQPGAAEELLPRSVQRLLAERLAALSRGSLDLLRVAAVFGAVVPRSLLDDLAPAVDADAALAEARTLGFVVESRPSGELRFTHALVRDAICAGLPGEERRRLHLHVADTRSSAPGDHLAEVAFHLAEAAPLGGIERTLDALRRAGDQARAAFDFEQAYDLYARAIELGERWPHPDSAFRCELLIRAGEVAVHDRELQEGRLALEEAMELARAEGDAERFARAALLYAYSSDYLAAASAEVVDRLREAHALLDHRDAALRARVLSRLAVEERYRRDGVERAESLVAEATQLATAAGDSRTLARVLEDTSLVRWSPLDPESWIALNHDIVRASRASGDYDLLFQGMKGLVTGYMEIGDRAAMDRQIDASARLAQAFPAPYPCAAAGAMRAGQALLDGDFAAAERLLAEVLASGVPGVTGPALVQLYAHRLDTGRIGELEAPLREVVKGAPEVAAWRYALARLLVELERDDEASEVVARAGPPDDVPRDRTWLPGVAGLAETLYALGDAARADQLYRLLQPLARINVVSGGGSLYYGSVAHFLGLLALATERHDEARAHFASAARMHERMRARPWWLRTRLAQAELRRRCGEPAEAAAEASRVCTEAEALGMTGLAGRAR